MAVVPAVERRKGSYRGFAALSVERRHLCRETPERAGLGGVWAMREAPLPLGSAAVEWEHGLKVEGAIAGIVERWRSGNPCWVRTVVLGSTVVWRCFWVPKSIGLSDTGTILMVFGSPRDDEARLLDRGMMALLGCHGCP
ncbi:hypothetical protein M0R45_019910 [Rubus argutus]|uniref:Uncharacterized protein n=1 Tax=Rubus argutus TaxID=59490 RepID=A0AAW1XAC7_RUBAR